jgi:hypothetical protein
MVNRITSTEDWESRLNKFIEATDRTIIQNVGKVSAESEFEKYRIIQDQLFESDFDKEIKLKESVIKPMT